MQTIQQYQDQANTLIESSLPILEARFRNHVSLLCLEIWLFKVFPELATRFKDRNKLLRDNHKLIYDAGMVSEKLMFKLLSLDNVSCPTPELREARRAAVCHIQLLMKRSDFLHARAKRVLALPVFYPQLERLVPIRPVSAAAATVASTSDMQSANTKSRVYSDTIR